MTIQECIDASLQLLNQYSITGGVVPLSYNDQADDVMRMVNLINGAVMEIATTVRPIIEAEIFEVPKLKPHAPVSDIEHRMPDNFYMPQAVLFAPGFGRDRTFREARDYKWLGNDALLVPNNVPGTYRVEYSRYPEQYDLNTDRENTMIDNTPDTHSIIPYYVAAMVAQSDDAKTYYTLYNVWETRLSRLGYRPPHATYEAVEDAYGLNTFHGVW